MSTDTIEVTLTQSPTELYKILKFEGLASSGAEAKIVISQGLVTVNGNVETQKRKKIVNGDVITFNGDTLHIIG
ncbi:MAG: RNA-binding S4 domain-containing protein [Piscirickettsiaceae bacterium]|nr:RNA-binding S4 domain-containing protein [Piscirickettsiaceae bacterium]